MNKKLAIIGIILAYFLSAGISYSLFSVTGSGGKASKIPDASTPAADLGNDYEAVTFDPNQTRNQECPLNGAKYSKEQKNWWEQHRPLGVMIENHQEARPQSGISFADVTYEVVAEGGITRTLNVYYCQDGGIVGPVRSARTYFLDFISEYGDHPLYTHVGGANCNAETGSGCLNGAKADALGQIEKYGWLNYNDLSQFSLGFPVFKRDEGRLDHDVATEHTVYSTTTKLWGVAKSRGLTNKDKEGTPWDEGFIPYTFKEDAPLAERPEAQTISVEFWSNQPNYDVEWNYDKQNNIYLRKNGGVTHDDRNTHKQLSTKNLVILFMKESPANDGYDHNAHLLYGTKGTGKALFFMDGKQTKGTWSKEGRTEKTKLLAADGSELTLDRGKIWFQVLPLDSDITVK